jgi:ArsR family transcriptional regulator, arsenate/arsenite/antimonite-responsive transcriptional repressor
VTVPYSRDTFGSGSESLYIRICEYITAVHFCQSVRTSSKSVSDKFSAFSDPTRLRILHLLLQGELCVGDLVAILDMPQPTVSRHLAYLRRSALVDTRKGGLWVYYRLAAAKSELHRKLLDCLAACFIDVPELKSDARRAAKVRKAGGCCPTEPATRRRG